MLNANTWLSISPSLDVVPDTTNSLLSLVKAGEFLMVFTGICVCFKGFIVEPSSSKGIRLPSASSGWTKSVPGFRIGLPSSSRKITHKSPR